MSESKFGICAVIAGLLIVAGAVLWGHVDEQHQLTTRLCLQMTKDIAACERFTEVP